MTTPTPNPLLETAKAAILADLRGRKLLKWLFRADADADPHPIGYVDGPIDNVTQDEIATALALAALSEVRECLLPFAKAAVYYDEKTFGSFDGEPVSDEYHVDLNVGHLRKARALLDKLPDKGEGL